MKAFLRLFAPLVLGILCGFDRLRFRGSQRRLCYPEGVLSYFSRHSILLKDYRDFRAEETTRALCQAIETPAQKAGIFQYLNNCEDSKEETALAMAKKHGQTKGLIAVLSCVEPSMNLVVRKNKESKLLEPRLERGKCLHYYHYYLDADFGLRYSRLQSWFPFTMHVGLNGRNWLGQQMLKAGIKHSQHDNCFTWIEDFEAAQKLLDEQLKMAWVPLLEGWMRESFPQHETLLPEVIPYYWSVQEAEYATDITFRSAEDLAHLYPTWVHHAYATLHGRDLLQFMSYRVRPDGLPLALGEIKTTIKELREGTCVRHRILNNLLKMYDKWGNLRVENMLLDLEHFKVFRTKEGDDDGPMSYRRLRKGVADLHRRAEVSQKINDRYIESLASVEEKETVAEVTKDLGKRVQWKGRSVRALNPLSPEDVSLLEAVVRGSFLISGFCNREIREILFPSSAPVGAAEQKRLSAKVTRLLRMLRGHGLITKVPKTLRYQVTPKGRTSIAALLAARQANTKLLLQAA